jgi:hypothetical protein
MAAGTELNTILRGSPKTASTYGRTLRVRPGDDGVDCFTVSQDDVETGDLPRSNGIFRATLADKLHKATLVILFEDCNVAASHGPTPSLGLS